MARKNGICPRKDHAGRKVEISCGLLESAVAANQTSTFARVVPVLHIYFSGHETLSECLRKFCMSTYHEPENPINCSSAAVGI